MVSSAPNSPGGVSAARSRADTGANLLQELEALSQALYKASQAQNVISGGPPGPSPRKDNNNNQYHNHQQQQQQQQPQQQQQQQQQHAHSGSSAGLQRLVTMPARTIDVFGKHSSLGGGGGGGGGGGSNAAPLPNRRGGQVMRHSISSGRSAPLYEENDQEELWKHPKHARHSIAATPRPLPPNMFGLPEEEEDASALPRSERKLQPWHSQGFEKNLPQVTNFPEWLEDNMNFSRKLEAAPEKKKSIWNWKPFRTLSHIGHTRYNCLFTLHVHAIESLPQAMNGLRLTVHWRHKDRAVQTMPSRVFQGSAEFEETLQLRCSVYGSKSAHQAVKFMPKAFTLGVIALDVDELVLGQHRLDLSKLLPEAPEHEHENDDKPVSWTTSFKLAGKAKGGTLVVTFGYELLQKEKGDKSARFGSGIGSPSPSMSSPSLRSYSGSGSHSTHGTPRPRPVDGSNFYSPTVSEPGDYHDYMAMEHLNLDESPRYESGSGGRYGENSSRGSRAVKSRYHNNRIDGQAVEIPYTETESSNVFGLPQPTESTPPLAPLTPRQTEELAEPKKEPHQDHHASTARDSYGDSDEEDREFVVVDQGVEVGTLPEDIQYPEHRYDEASVVGFDNLGKKQLASPILENKFSFDNRYDGATVNLADLGKNFAAKSPPSALPEQNFSLDWPDAGAEAEAEEEDKVVLPEFHRVEQIPGPNTVEVRSVTDWGQEEEEVQEKEGKESSRATAAEDVDEAAKQRWDPLGRFEQRVRNEQPVQELKLVDAVGSKHGLEEEEERYGDIEIDQPLTIDHPPKSEEVVVDHPPKSEEDVVVVKHPPAEIWDLHEKHQQENVAVVEEPEAAAAAEPEEEVEEKSELKEEVIAEEKEEEFGEVEGTEEVGVTETVIWKTPEEEEEEEEELGVTETVNWETPPSSPPHYPASGHEDSIVEQRDLPAEVEVEEIEVEEEGEEEEPSSSSMTSFSFQQPTVERDVDRTHSQTLFEDLDNEVDLIAGDFLSMLEGASDRGGRLSVGMSSDSENESPRALLLRQFEQEALLEGGIGLRLGGNEEMPELNLDSMGDGMAADRAQSGFSVVQPDGAGPEWQSGEDEELASIMEAAESELQKATQTMRSKTRAKMLEDAETEALMQEWGLNERAFENSPPKQPPPFVDVIGSQISKVPTEPPVLAQGVGPVVQTKDGGMLRSMTPSLFSQSNASGKLVMQVSKPVVVPSEMGSSGLDIFRRLASGGVENMALQAMVAMPLEDITGKSVHQIAYESKAALEGPSYGQAYLPSNGYSAGPRVGRYNDSAISTKSKARGPSKGFGPADPSEEFVSLEELAPMAMQKIETLAVDGLKIQADMTDEAAPYAVDSIPWSGGAGTQQGSKFKKGRGVGSLEGVAAMHLLDSRSFSDDTPVEADGLMSKVISIDEWMRLDAGHYDENDTKDETLAILAAHGVVHKDVVARGSKEDRIRYLQGAKASANFGKGGFMGNTLTIAMLVQLRDPLRNNEPVGAPMMALVQAERVIVPPRPKIPRRSPSMLGNSEVWEEEESLPEAPPQPQFKVTAVHMSGLKPTEEQNKDKDKGKPNRLWGNQKQQQSGSRWLAANGMGKTASASSKIAALKGRPGTDKETTARPGESLWSISSRVHGTGSKWKEVGSMNPHIRNPDVSFAKQKFRTR
ncbi:unnamed protein product [Calypogeia fissa]